MKRLLGVLAIVLWGGVPMAAHAAEHPKNVYEYYVWFWTQKNVTDIVEELKERRVVRDDKNGWMQVEVRDDTQTFVIWRGGPARHTFVGLSRTGRIRDPGASYDTYDVTFGEDVDGRLVVREDLVPPITLRDFWDEAKPVPEGNYGIVRFEFVLPRKGTSIQVRLHPELSDNIIEPGDDPGDFSYDKYLADLKTAKYGTLELVWDKQAGKFVKGAKTLARKGAAP